MPYSLGIERLETVPLDKIKNRLTKDEEHKLTDDMEELYKRLRPEEKMQSKREKFVGKLETMFNEEWPGHNIQVHIFGSSGNLLCSDDSDGWFLPFSFGLSYLTFGTSQANTRKFQWTYASLPTGKIWRTSA